MEIFKELNKKGYKHYCEGTVEELDDMDRNNPDLHSEIMQVIMWLYEKHGLWTNVVYMGFELKYSWSIDIVTTSGSHWDSYGEEGDICYNSPTEAYESAIEYTLNNLI